MVEGSEKKLLESDYFDTYFVDDATDIIPVLVNQNLTKIKALQIGHLCEFTGELKIENNIGQVVNNINCQQIKRVVVSIGFNIKEDCMYEILRQFEIISLYKDVYFRDKPKQTKSIPKSQNQILPINNEQQLKKQDIISSPPKISPQDYLNQSNDQEDFEMANLSELGEQIQNFMTLNNGITLLDVQSKFTDCSELGLQEALENIIVCGMAYKNGEKYYLL